MIALHIWLHVQTKVRSVSGLPIDVLTILNLKDQKTNMIKTCENNMPMFFQNFQNTRYQ